ncbi:hypothetical protein FQZ97_994100 [compost metagenome]
MIFFENRYNTEFTGTVFAQNYGITNREDSFYRRNFFDVFDQFKISLEHFGFKKLVCLYTQYNRVTIVAELILEFFIDFVFGIGGRYSSCRVIAHPHGSHIIAHYPGNGQYYYN